MHPDYGVTVYAAYGHITSLLFSHTALLKADSLPRHHPFTASSYLRKLYDHKETCVPTSTLECFPVRSPETRPFEGRALERVLQVAGLGFVRSWPENADDIEAHRVELVRETFSLLCEVLFGRLPYASLFAGRYCLKRISEA